MRHAGPPDGASAAYVELFGILQQHVSGLLAKSTLTQALVAVGQSPATFGRVDADAVVEHVMVGLRVFCDKDRLPELMIALADFCTGKQGKPL